MIFVWLTKSLWKEPGPIAYVCLLNALSMAQQGHETHLLVGDDGSPSPREDLRTHYGLEPHPGLSLHLVDQPKSRLMGQARRLIRELAEREPVAVFSREPAFLGPMARLSQNHKNVACFYESHDLRVTAYGPDRPSLRRRLQGWNERLRLPRLDGLVCITGPQRERYAQALPRIPSISLPLGSLALDDSAPAAPPRRRVIYLGHLHPTKGVRALVEAAGTLQRRNLELWLLGGYASQIESIRSHPEVAGAGNRVRAMPFQSPRRMHELLAEGGGVGLAPLEDNFYNRYLTCPVKILDYLAHALPTVASDLTSTRDLLGEDGAGRFVPPGNAVAALDAGADLLDDPRAYAEAAAAARRRARTLAWPRRAQALHGWATERLSEKRGGRA
jgi:glycosyltransferase involved in cell wall biosynthesis